MYKVNIKENNNIYSIINKYYTIDIIDNISRIIDTINILDIDLYILLDNISSIIFNQISSFSQSIISYNNNCKIFYTININNIDNEIILSINKSLNNNSINIINYKMNKYKLNNLYNKLYKFYNRRIYSL